MDAENPFAVLSNVTVNIGAYETLVEILDIAQPASDIITVATLCLLLGILTTLTSAAVYLLAKKGINRLSIKILIFCTLLLCACSWTFCSLQIARDVSTKNSLSFLSRNINTQVILVSDITDARTIVGIDIASTLMMTINIIIGDAIVWWRACVIWPGNFLVRVVCVLLLLTTTATAIASVALSTSQQFSSSYGFYFQNQFGTASIILSLTTNIIATSLIAYKTWQHWRILRVHLGNGKATKRVLKILALLVESGVMYSFLLGFIAAWQSLLLSAESGNKVNPNARPILLALIYLLLGCLVPLIAMYPTLIIVLVSLEQSQLERGITAAAGASKRRPRPTPLPLPSMSQPISDTLVSPGSTFTGTSEKNVTAHTHERLPSLGFVDVKRKRDIEEGDVQPNEASSEET